MYQIYKVWFNPHEKADTDDEILGTFDNESDAREALLECYDCDDKPGYPWTYFMVVV